MSWWESQRQRIPERPELEKELVRLCHQSARKMGVYLEVAGQRMAKGSGTTVGFPDAFLYCSGKCLPIEFKAEKGRLSPGQVLAQHKRMDQRVHTWVIRKVEDFEELVNMCRRTA